MYPKIDLYKIYLGSLVTSQFSTVLPDVTKKHTLENINYAINVTDKWDVCMDVGGGSGHYLAAIASKFKKAILIEVQKLPEQEIYRKKIENIEVVNSYIEEYNSKQKVDFILLADLYEHIPEIENFIIQLSSLQENGGVIYIMTPNPIYCGPAPESGLYYTRHPNGHIKQYTTYEITKLMNKYGYQLILKLNEEAPFRQRAKHFIFAISKRDEKWRKQFWFQIIRPLFLLFALPVLKILEYLTYKSEIKYRYNELVTMTQDLVFKKVNDT